jgi:hypothetical protein
MKFGTSIQIFGILLRNAILGGNIESLRLWRQPRAMADYMRQCVFLYKAYTSTRGMPQKNVFEVLPNQGVETIRLSNLNQATSLYGEPWFHAVTSYSVDLINLCLVCQIAKPKVVFEIGTLRGYTALHFALNTPDESRIFTLDLPADQRGVLNTTTIDNAHVEAHNTISRYIWESVTEADKITPEFGDSATFDFSPWHGGCDFFFIDGAHSYEYVRSDTLNAMECCHTGSVIAWHDYGRLGVNGVARWLNELARNEEIYVVPGGSLAFMVKK